jgi:uncharacterized protein (TIGR00369 family)
MSSAPRIQPIRSRSFYWEDPQDALRRGKGLSGLAFLRGIVDGSLPQPPLGDAMGFRLVEAEEGRALFTLPIAEHHYNLIGSVHGGVCATLIDSATGCAIMSTISAGDRWTTLSLSVDYLAALDAGSGLVRCEARVVRAGKRIAIADAEVRDVEGRVYARGSTTCLIMRA